MRRWLYAGAVLPLLAWGATVIVTAPPAEAHTAINPADWQQIELARGVAEVGEPMSLAVLPDRSVLHTARNGTLRRTDVNGTTSVVANIPVYTHDEEGLQGVAVDPNFASNRFIYLYYAPPLSTPGGDAPNTGNASTWATWQGVNRLSRFTLGTNWALSGEATILDVPADRGICCHVGGDIDFDAAGNLYLSTGDDTNPFDSAGYAPIDERTDRNPAYDAQRSSGNTNDLRGKILRIRPNATGGGYTVPAGNLFAPGTANTRAEIYAMGFRNPFRMSVDKATGVVYVGDYGPDAGSTDPNRGPSGQVEFDRVPSPGNYGWPYCTGTNTTNETYNEWNFATNSTGPKYNCAGGPTNNSFRNTGQQTLPPARASWIRYAGDAGSPPEFGNGSESPMGGPVYRYDAANPSPIKFPADFDGHYFAGEFGRRWIKTVHVNTDGSAGSIIAFPWTGTQVMDMAFGPDGALYVLDYGTGFGSPDSFSALYRIEYIGSGTNRAPIARAAATPTSGPAPLTVNFSSAGSSDPDGQPITYSWAFGDGTTSTAANPTKTYNTAGTFTATLTVRDPAGATGSASVQVSVGNTAPTVNIITPGNGSLFSFGGSVPWQVQVTDPEDGAINCTRVRMTYLIGHDSHAHQITSQTGCSGTITVPVDGEHDAAANVFGVWDAEYTDNGGLTTHKQSITQPRHRQAEHFGAMQGISLINKTNAEGGRTVGEIQNGDWVSFTPYNVSGATSFTARVSSGGPGGTLSLRAGSATGTLLGSVAVPNTGSFDTFINVNGTLSNIPSNMTTLFLVFTGSAGALFDVDWFEINSGTPPPPPPPPPPGRVEAESFSSQFGTQNVADGNASGGVRVGYIDGGDWLGFSSVNVSGRTGITARVASGGQGGQIQVRTGSQTGPVLGTLNVPNTGGYGTFIDVSAPISAGSGALFLAFVGTGAGGLFDVDNFVLTGGTTPPPPPPPPGNLALNKAATADSSCNANEGPAKAVNGTVNGGNTDKWCSVSSSKWWQVDLGSSMTVGRLVVRHAGAGGENAVWNTRDFDIQVSTNGTTWTTVSSPRGNTANVSTHTITATQARYVRMNVLVPTSNTDTAARIYEFEAYAS